MTRAWAALAVSAALVLGAVAGCAPQRAIEAEWVLADLAAGSGPSPLKERRPPPLRTTVELPEAAVANLYLPGDATPRGGLVIVPGAARTGKDDPRLVALAETMARARFAVLVPDLPNARALRVGPEDVDGIARAVNWLAARQRRPVGVAAVSYAAGPAVLAAARPDLADKVGFIVTIGGYYDLQAVVTFFTTGFFRATPTSPWRWRQPNDYGKWVFVLANAGRLDDARDGDLLAAIARRKMDDMAADVSGLERRLGPQGRSVMALLDNKDPARVAELVAALPPAMRADMAALDPAQADLGRLRATLILVHGRDDAIIPYSESLALAASVPAGQAHLYLLDNLAHADLRAGGVQDAVRLWRAVYRLLAERDRPPGRPPERRAGGWLELAARAASGQ